MKYNAQQNAKNSYTLAIREMRRAKLTERAAQKASAPPSDDEAEAL